MMTSMRDCAQGFFDACETGKGWDACKQYCHPAASFSGQAGALTGVNTVYVMELAGETFRQGSALHRARKAGPHG